MRALVVVPLLLLPLACDACPLAPPAGVCTVNVPVLDLEGDVEAGGWGNNSEYVELLDGGARLYIQDDAEELRYDVEALFDAAPAAGSTHRWPSCGDVDPCAVVASASGEARVGYDLDGETFALTALQVDVEETAPRFAARVAMTFGENELTCDYDVYSDDERDPSDGDSD